MSEIIKSEAVVLSKLNYGDTSLIISLYTELYGKISAIIKGGRNPKSKMGMIAEPLNHVQVVVYKKDTRDIQLLSGIDLISHYPRVRDDLEKTQYALAIIELIKKLTVDNEVNKRLFKGLTRILTLIDSEAEHPGILFNRFYIFLLAELGYALQLSTCSICKKELGTKSGGFKPDVGFVCVECFEAHPALNFASAELLNYFFCLNNKIHVNNISLDLIKQANIFLDKYSKYHIPDFNGIQSLNIFNNFKKV